MLHALKLPSPRLQPALLTMALGTTGLAAPDAFAEGAAQATAPSQLGTVIVTGNRGSEKRTVTTSPVPIDVISAKQLQQTGKPGLMEASAPPCHPSPCRKKPAGTPAAWPVRPACAG